MRDFIERMRMKPEHERRRFALLASFGSTALVALVWATATISSGNLAIKSSTGGVGEVQNAVAKSQNSFSQLLGAVSAFKDASSSNATLEIEDVPKSEDAPTGSDTRTVIPF